MNEKKLDLICDLNSYVAEAFEDYYKDIEDNKDSDYFMRQIAENIKEIGVGKIKNRDTERLMMVANLLKATNIILSELKKELN